MAHGENTVRGAFVEHGEDQARRNLSVRLPALVGVAPRFVLRDLYGREVYSGYLRNFDTEIPLEGLPTGMYVWQLYWRGVPLQNGKVVKM